MSRKIEAYIPDLDKIAEHSQDHEPLVLLPEEYDEILERFKLYRGTMLADEGLLIAMEAGLIKVWDEEGSLDLSQVQSASLDLRLGPEFWYYRRHTGVDSLILGSHRREIEENDILGYTCKREGEIFAFHPDSLVLALTREGIALSNVVYGLFDGKSSGARLGMSNHQTAGGINAGFSGQLVMEFSDSNHINVGVPVGKSVASMRFHLLDRPSTRPENLKADSVSRAYGQVSPFGFRRPEWDEIREKVLKGGNGFHAKEQERAEVIANIR